MNVGRRTIAAAAVVGMAAGAWLSPGRAYSVARPYGHWSVIQGPDHTGMILDPHLVVRVNTIPSCDFEDGSGEQAFPCTWNINRGDGNGAGRAYYLTGEYDRHLASFVWARNPAHDGWKWPTRKQERHLDTHQQRDWSVCVIKVGGTTRVKCPDGLRATS